MSHRLEMIQAARLAPQRLKESTQLVCRFLDRQWNRDGGCKNRSGQSDLYYTVFALDSAISLGTTVPLEAVTRYLNGFGSGEGLDLVHLACLARCWASLREFNGGEALSGRAGIHALASEILARIEKSRAGDGGYRPAGGAGTAYATFLAMGAYEDWGAPMPDPYCAVRFLQALRLSDGCWSHDRTIAQGSTPTTAAAITALNRFHCPLDSAAIDFLFRMLHPMGGFLATPLAPAPDLLSTATALDALESSGADISGIREVCLDFIDTLWSNEGGFFSHWQDDALDGEYLFYGLLALGRLGR